MAAPLKVVLAYATFAALWILLSDRAVGLIFHDSAQLTMVSTLKGWLFVVVTSVLLYGLVDRLTKRPKPLPEEGISPEYSWWWRGLIYGFAIASTLGSLGLRLSIAIPFGDRPLLILFMFPVILSAFIGGIGPGLVSTLVAGLAVDYFIIPPVHSLGIEHPFDQLQFGFLLANGLLVSLLSEVFHRSRRQLEAQWRLQVVTLESIGDAVITADTTGRIRFLNPAAERIAGWSSQEASGQPLGIIFRIVDELTRQPAEDPVRQAMAASGGIGASSHTLLISREGRETPILHSVSPIRLRKGPPLGIVVAFRDDSERRALIRTQEEKLRALQLLDAITHASTDVIFAKDLQGRYLFYNQQGLRFVGKNLEEVIGHDDRSIYPAAEAARLMASNRKLLELGQSTTGEWTLTTRLGPRTFQSSTQPLRDPEGQITGLFGIARDITEHKSAELAMREKDASYRSLFENMMNTVARCRMIFENGLPVDYVYLEVNPAFEKNTGLYGVVGKRVGEVLPNYREENSDSLEKFGQVVLTGEPARWVHYLKGLDMWFSFSVYRPAPGEFVVVSDNITEQKKAEIALQESERNLERAQAIAHVGSWSLPVEDGQMVCSDETYRILGLSKEESLDLVKLFSLVHAEDQEQVRGAWERAKAGTPFEVEHRILVGGDVRWVRQQAEVCPVWESRPSFGFGTIQDITERKLSELEKSKLQAEFLQAQKLESIGRLAGGVAHDFNNMLQVIEGNAELALGRVPPSDPLHGEIQLIKRAAERSADLTRQLLAFARRQAISPKVLDLNDAVSNMVKMLGRIVSEDIKLVLTPRIGLWRTRIDPAQLDQILANLTVNARDAITGIGTISLETDNATWTELDCAGVLGARPGAYVCLSVSDSGSGMPPEVLEHIFEPFFTTKESGKGTGLGLATVFGIAQQNGGFVQVMSQVGAGTVFRVYFPKYEEVDGAPLQAPEAAPRRGQGEKILLVEDEEALLFVGESMLRELGYDVQGLGFPAKALQFVQESAERIDLFLIDVVMPGMNGRELGRRLSLLRPDVPILFMSGYAADVIADQGPLDEGLRLISKPFSMNELSLKLREILDHTG
jgi:two-component system, cell cycle sensor histidine kinase and response regulator CckA